MIAIRGDRLALSWLTARWPSGNETRARSTSSKSTSDGRLLAYIEFGDADLEAAVAELDARYLAGEGAAHAEATESCFAWIRAMGERDLPAIQELAADGFVCVDHRQLGWATLDKDEFIELTRQYDDVEQYFLAANVRVSDRASLATIAVDTTSSPGGGPAWRYHALGLLGPDGCTVRIETFAEDDWDAALARFDELSRTKLRTQRVENAASRAYARLMSVVSSATEEGQEDLLAPEYRWEDRRRVVNMGELDRAGVGAMLSISRQQGLQVGVPNVVAVRGERLALNAIVARTPEGDETSTFTVVEVDEQHRLLSTVVFDDSALAAAEAELDARFLAGEGAPHAELLRVHLAGMRVFQSQDFVRVREHLAPDFVWVDHRELSWGTLDVDGFIAQQETYADLHHSYLSRTLDVAGRSVLATIQDEATSDDGTETHWVFHAVATFDASDRCARMEIFPEDDWEGALARFDELSPPARPRAIENTASRVWARTLAAIDSGDNDVLTDLFAREYRYDDRRPIVNLGALDRAGGAELLERWLDAEGWHVGTPTVIAIRGDRLALSTETHRTATGDENHALTVVEIDEHGRLVAGIVFGEADLVAALAELDARHRELAGGVDSPETMFLESVAAMNRRDWDGFAAHLAPEFVLVDHQPLSFGTTDGPGTVDVMRSMTDVMPDAVVVVQRTFESAGATLAAIKTTGRTPEGSRYEWRAHFVVRNSSTGVT